MHLQKTFPEIHRFFLKDHFDQEQLEKLKKDIKNNYVDRDLLKNAEALLKLELMKFQILKSNPEQIEKPQKIVLSKIEESSFKKSSFKKSNYTPPKAINRPKQLITVTYETSFPKQINNLCIKLKMTKSELVDMCLKKQINLAKSKSLNDSQLQNLIPLFQSRIGEIRAKELDESNKNKPQIKDSTIRPNNKQKNGSTWTNDVYDKIGTYGLGKIIYIRSK
jgi:hypothetical protein